MQLSGQIEWAPIEEAPHLRISTTGSVYSLSVKRMLIPQIVGIVGKQYYSIGVRKGRRSIHLKIHRLVAQAFLPNPENKPCVNHKDGNKLNNHVVNLEWATHSENALHAIETGLNPKRGNSNHNSKIKESELPTIREMCRNGIPQDTLAQAYGVSQSTISRIVTKTTYKTF